MRLDVSARNIQSGKQDWMVYDKLTNAVLAGPYATKSQAKCECFDLARGSFEIRRASDAFDACRKEFDKLTAPVNNDPLAQTEVADLVSAAQFEIDLHEEGEQDPPLRKSQVEALKRFVTKWKEVN